jgi:hypothetical protein
MKKRLAILLISIFSATCAYFVIRGNSAFAKSFQPRQSMEEFTTQEVVRMYDNSGQLRHTVVSVFAQRSDGSWVDERLSSDGKPLDGKKIVFDAAAGTRTSVQGSADAKTTYRLSPQDLAAAISAQSCSWAMKDPLPWEKIQLEKTERTTFLQEPVTKLTKQGRPA